MSDQNEAFPPVGSFCWNEMLTGDLPKAKHFYSRLFGWTPIETEMGPPDARYVLFEKNGKQVAGLGSHELGDLKDAKAPSTWLPHVNVEDLDSTLTTAKELGADLLSGPSAIPGIGRYAVIADPNGARVAVFQALAN